MVDELRAEIARLSPSRVLTIGSSMGGYAAVRAAIALNADLAVAFSPQVIIELKQRQAASLDPMHFDDLLSWLHVVGAIEGFELTSLIDAAQRAPLGCKTEIDLHVGAIDAGDVHEAEMLVKSVEARGGGAMRARMHVHANRDHNLVVGLRDSGELHSMLVSWLSGKPALLASSGLAAPAVNGSDRSGGSTAGREPKATVESATRRLEAGRPAEALAVIDAVLRLEPTSGAGWALRSKILVVLKRHVDAMMSLQAMRGLAADQPTADTANGAMAEAQRAQKEMGPVLRQCAKKAGEAEEKWVQMTQYETICRHDPTNVLARYELAAQRVASANDLQSKARLRSRGGNSTPAVALAREAHSLLHALLDDIRAFEAEAAQPAPCPDVSVLKAVARGDRSAQAVLDTWLNARRANCPLPPAQHMSLFNAKVEMQLGMACDVVHAACSGGSSGSSIDGARLPAAAGSGCKEAREGSASTDGIERSLEHFERSATLDGSTWTVYDLWHHAIEEHPRFQGQPEARRAAQARVHAQAVRAGVWGHPMQRPSHYIRGLLARPWHDPRDFAPCRALLNSYRMIRDEALELLQVDAAEARRLDGSVGGGSRVFCSYLSAVLEAGDWADVGLYYNGMRNEANAKRAPQTSALLGSNPHLRRDATSCPFGSAYFSLLRPGTRLGAHCGPTNGRLRAHLGLIVPDDESKGGGELRIVCAGEARRWVEGEVLLFDDSFEHAVWNETSKPRLVLIVDLWHPMLDTDEKRLAALNGEDERQVYLGVVKRNEYANTNQRGH